MKIQQTLTLKGEDIDFLTQKINEESKNLGIAEEAYPFAFFIRDDREEIIAGCNGSVIYGAIYTDQLWVSPIYRGQGVGRKLMEQVHTYGLAVNCTMATVATMNFQKAREFYESLGYVCDFERAGYVNGARCLFLSKSL